MRYEPGHLFCGASATRNYGSSLDAFYCQCTRINVYRDLVSFHQCIESRKSAVMREEYVGEFAGEIVSTSDLGPQSVSLGLQFVTRGVDLILEGGLCGSSHLY